MSLTIVWQGLRWRYHLRSLSGSNGPIAKETSPLLGWRPILICGFPTEILGNIVGSARLYFAPDFPVRGAVAAANIMTTS